MLTQFTKVLIFLLHFYFTSQYYTCIVLAVCPYDKSVYGKEITSRFHHRLQSLGDKGQEPVLPVCALCL